MNFEEKTTRTLCFEDEEEFNHFVDILNAALHEDLNALKVLKRDILGILEGLG